MAEVGLPVVVEEAAACPLCAQPDRPIPAPMVGRRDDALPWAIALTAAVVVASVGFATERWFGVGAVAALAAGALCAWFSVRAAVAARAAEKDAELRALAADADGRVAMVIRQFEWTVNDVAKLKREGDRAQVTADLLVVQGRARERQVRKLERQLAEARERLAKPVATTTTRARAEFDAESNGVSGAVAFRWGVHKDGASSRLELDCDVDAGPTRVRIVSRFGEVQGKSAMPIHTGHGSLSFALVDAPAGLIADLDAGRESAYRLEALCDYEWRAVRLEDTGRRTKMGTDKHGKMFRVTDASAPATHTSAFNPFDATADFAFVTL